MGQQAQKQGPGKKDGKQRSRNSGSIDLFRIRANKFCRLEREIKRALMKITRHNRRGWQTTKLLDYVLRCGRAQKRLKDQGIDNLWFKARKSGSYVAPVNIPVSI